MFDSLLPYLGTPRIHVLVLLLASTTAFQSLVALWAATSRRHWFWRALGVWAAVMALAPVRAYELLLIFAVSSPLTVLVVDGARRLGRLKRGIKPSDEQTKFQFRLADVLMATLLLGLTLAGLLPVLRAMPVRDWREIILPGLLIAVLNGLCMWIVHGPRRRWALAGHVAAWAALAWAMRWHMPSWIIELDPLGNAFPELLFTDAIAIAEWVFAFLLIAEFAAVLMVLVALLPMPPRVGILRSQPFLGGSVATTLAAVMSLLYLQMFWLTPFPPSLAADGSNYRRLLEIAQVVQQKDDSTDLPTLHSEVISLVASTQTLPFDLSAEPVLQLVERTSIDHIQAFRELSRSLEVESQAAAARGEMSHAQDLVIANLRLGGMFCRNASMLDALIGLAIQGWSTNQLVRLRSQLDAESLDAIGSELVRLEQVQEPATTIIWRDVAYSQRAYHWQARLQHILDWMIKGPPPQWEDNRSFQEAFNHLHAVHRLLQTDFAVRRFLLDHGRLPDSLTVLVPEYLPSVPLDPYTNEAFIYRPAGNELGLYSVGKDRIDNNGRFTKLQTYRQGDGYDLDLETLIRPE